jgi:hypothetical protein
MCMSVYNSTQPQAAAHETAPPPPELCPSIHCPGILLRADLHTQHCPPAYPAVTWKDPGAYHALPACRLTEASANCSSHTRLHQGQNHVSCPSASPCEVCRVSSHAVCMLCACITHTLPPPPPPAPMPSTHACPRQQPLPAPVSHVTGLSATLTHCAPWQALLCRHETGAWPQHSCSSGSSSCPAVPWPSRARC